MLANNQTSPLILAARSGDRAEVTRLLELGEPLEAKDLNGWTALRTAITHRHAEVALALVQAGADVNARDVDRYTPLMVAALVGIKEVCEVLIDHDAEIDAQDNSRWTPLMWAASRGHTDVCQLLLAKGASMTFTDKRDRSAEVIARNEGFAETSAVLRNSSR